MPFQVLDIDDDSVWEDILTLIDNHLTIVNEEVSNPNGVIACAFPGIYYYYPPTESLFICKTAGDAETTEWSPIYFSINEATTDSPGIVVLATPSEVATGTDPNKACTPYSVANAFTLLTVHQTDKNNLQTQITANASSISSLSNTIGLANSVATPSRLAKYDSNGNLEVADATAEEDAVNLGQLNDVESSLQTQITTAQDDLNAAVATISANKLVRADSNGKIVVPVASANGNPVRKDTFDTLATTVSDNTSDISGLDTRLDTAESDIDTAQSDITTLQSNLAKVLGGADIEALTLNGSNIATPTKGNITLDTNGGAGTQDCNRLVTTNNVKLLLVQGKDAGHVITLKHNQSGDGKLIHLDASDIILGVDRAVLYAQVGTEYHEVARFGYAPSGTTPSVQSKTTTFTATYNTIYKCDTSGGAYTVTFPTAAGHTEEWVEFVKVTSDANAITLDGNSSETLNGSLTITMTTIWQTRKFVSDGSNWIEITHSNHYNLIGGNGSRQCPTSGSISGVYYHNGPLTTTGAWTIADGTRIYCNDVITINHDPTLTRPNNGGQCATGAGGYFRYEMGRGPGGGSSPMLYPYRQSGGGGGFGGNGGNGGGGYQAGGYGGRAYDIRQFFASSGGASGSGEGTSDIAGAGGNGGNCCYLEARKGIVFNANWTATGQNGTAGSGGNYGPGGAGGSGGGLIASAGEYITINSGKTISVAAGNGASASSVSCGAGPGGGGGWVILHAPTVTNNGTITTTGGSVGATGSTTLAPTAGSSGQSVIIQEGAVRYF